MEGRLKDCHTVVLYVHALARLTSQAQTSKPFVRPRRSCSRPCTLIHRVPRKSIPSTYAVAWSCPRYLDREIGVLRACLPGRARRGSRILLKSSGVLAIDTVTGLVIRMGQTSQTRTRWQLTPIKDPHCSRIWRSARSLEELREDWGSAGGER